jgi:hypothetical protein
VVLFDAVASAASLALNFAYSIAAIGSMLIYGTLGYFAYRIGGMGICLRIALAVGLVDATLGWGVSWVIGPGELPADQRSAPIIVAAVAFAIAADVLAALIGAGTRRVFSGRFEH